MIVIVDERELVREGYTSMFFHEGVSSVGMSPADFGGWFNSVPGFDVVSVEDFLLGDCPSCHAFPRVIKNRTCAPIITLSDNRSLDCTLELFELGVDDVVHKPVHVREILARIGAIKRRVAQEERDVVDGSIRVFFDGRDPEVGGEVFQLPRRERRILEYLVSNKGRRVTKSQIFNSVYGLFDECTDENVVESHISKLRKKLRHRLGKDPIDSKRYLGYQVNCDVVDTEHFYPEKLFDEQPQKLTA